MKQLRIANVTYLSALPFRHLAECDALRYEENTAIENARRLHEGEVDVALISCTDYAAHGGYVGLDFGLGCRARSESLMLYARRPLEELKTIHLYESASSSAYLLRLLLIQKWGITPRLVRRSERDLLRYVGGDEGVLVMHDPPVPLKGKFPVAIDLALAWNELTDKSYVSLIWAIRPGSLGRDQHRLVNEMLHQCLKAREVIATHGALELNLPAELYSRYVTTIRQYYLDQQMLDGLDEFFRRAALSKLLPECHYRSATLSLMGGTPTKQKRERVVQRLVESAFEGARLSIRDGVRLASEANLADLGLLLDTKRRASESSEESDAPTIAERTEPLHEARITWRLRRPTLDFFEEFLTLLKAHGVARVEGLSAPLLARISRVASVSLEEGVARLVTAGLDCVGSGGGGMLIDRLRADDETGVTAEWITTMKWVHRFGARSRAELEIDPAHTWEDRFVHLHKLRVLQDENPGFESLHLVTSGEYTASRDLEIFFRALAVTSCFIDNTRLVPPDERADRIPQPTFRVDIAFNQMRITADREHAERAERLRQAVEAIPEIAVEPVRRPMAHPA